MCPSPDLEGLTAAQLCEMVVSLQSQLSERDARIEAHDALLCIADKTYVAEKDRRKLTPDHRLKSPEEMIELFRDLPEAFLDKNEDGVVSREEWGGPRMDWPSCLEMLYRNAEPTALGLAVRWLCQRDRERPTPEGKDEL